MIQIGSMEIVAMGLTTQVARRLGQACELRPTESVAAIGTAPTRKWIKSAPEFSRHLFDFVYGYVSIDKRFNVILDISHACYLLIGGTPTGDEHDMKAGQSKNRDGQDADKSNQAKGDDRGHLRQPILMLDKIVGREAEHGRHVKRERQEEEEKVAVIPPSDAIIHPRTVMVECLSEKTTTTKIQISLR